MASDRPKRPGGGFSDKARAAAVTRFIKKHIGVVTNNSTSRGDYGIRVMQERFQTEVAVSVSLPADAEAVTWSTELEDVFRSNGFEVRRATDVTLYVARPQWRIDDRMLTLFSRCFGRLGEQAISTDTGLINAPEHILRSLREQGVFRGDTLRFTELGEQARAWALVQQKKEAEKSRRRKRERGW